MTDPALIQGAPQLISLLVNPKNRIAPPCLLRGPEAGDPRYQYDFLGSVGIIFLPLFAYSLTAARKVTPSLSQRGRQPKGSNPVIHLTILPF